MVPQWKPWGCSRPPSHTPPAPPGAPACSQPPSSPRTSPAPPLTSVPSHPGPPLLWSRSAEFGLFESLAFCEVSQELGALFPAWREWVHGGSSGLAPGLLVGGMYLHHLVLISLRFGSACDSGAVAARAGKGLSGRTEGRVLAACPPAASRAPALAAGALLGLPAAKRICRVGSVGAWRGRACGEAPSPVHHNKTLIRGFCRRQRESCSCFIWGWEEALHPGSTLPREIRETWPPTALACQESRLPYVQTWCQKCRSHRQQATHPLPHTFPAFSLLLFSLLNQLTFFTTRKQSNNFFSCFSSSSPTPPSPPVKDAVSTPKAWCAVPCKTVIPASQWGIPSGLQIPVFR